MNTEIKNISRDPSCEEQHMDVENQIEMECQEDYNNEYQVDDFNYNYEGEAYMGDEGIDIDYCVSSAPGLYRASSYTILKTTDIEKIRNQLIENAAEFCSLTKEEATIVLINYQWNYERIKDQWYDNVEENRKKCAIEQSNKSREDLKRKKVDPNNQVCSICYKDYDCTFYSLSCKHNFCGDCWTDYLSTKLEDLLTSISSTCPQNMCNLIVPENVFKLFIPKNKIPLFEKAIFKNFTDNNVDIKWCPTPNCEICIRCITHAQKEIQCECMNVFCFQCGKEGHRPCVCEMIETWSVKNNSESENVKWLMANTKQCPNCHKYIEKNQGCNHMCCRKEAGGCAFEFCWICLGEWAPHGSSYYQCNKYDPNKEENKKKENNSKQAKYELERYIFFFDRYMNHDRAQKLSVKMRDTIQEEISQFNKMKNVPFDELKFLEEAVEVIIKSRRTLKNTYVFGFYMKDCQERQLFEHNQCLLERDADKLHEFMENDCKQKLLDTVNYEEFWKGWTLYKANVTNLAAVTVKYQENLLNDIEMKMMELVDYKALK
jgi:ariadne-1